MKEYLVVKFGRDVGFIDIVCFEEGRIYKDFIFLNEILRLL